MKSIRIMFVEDDLDYRYLIEQALKKEADFELCACCSDGETAVHTALDIQPDIVLMDLCLNGSILNGANAARRIRLQTDARVIILTSHEDFETVIRAGTQALAQAHLICSALLAPLTDAERSVLHHILGEDVGLHSSSKTISNQQTGILRKLGFASKKELTHVFKAYGFVQPEDQEK